jgi:hypothetical protein
MLGNIYSSHTGGNYTLLIQEGKVSIFLLSNLSLQANTELNVSVTWPAGTPHSQPPFTGHTPSNHVRSQTVMNVIDSTSSDNLNTIHMKFILYNSTRKRAKVPLKNPW